MEFSEKALQHSGKPPTFHQPVCRGKYLFLVIYLLQLDGVNSLLLTVASIVGPDSLAYCCALCGTRWHSYTFVVMLLPPHIAVTIRHGVGLATSLLLQPSYRACRERMCATDGHPKRLRVLGWCMNGRRETLKRDTNQFRLLVHCTNPHATTEVTNWTK